MAWIESHEGLARHPKTKKLARLLGENVPSAIGRLHLLWWWALEYAQDGCLSRYDPDDIADAVMWEGDPQEVIDALCKAGFLDEDEDGLHVHDWDDYAGRLIEQRQKNADRKRRSRGRHADVTGPSRETDTTVTGLPNLTKPDQTIPNHTVPNQPNQVESESSGSVPDVDMQIYRHYEETFGRPPNHVQISRLSYFVEKGAEVELVLSAMTKARENGKDLGYAIGILRNQYDQGIRTLAQAEKEDARRARAPTDAKRKTSGQGGVNRGVDRRDDGTDDDWDAIEERFFRSG